MDRRTALRSVAALTMPALAGCGGGDGGGGEDTPTETVVVDETVEVGDGGFSETRINVPIGEGVEFVNAGDTTHTIVSDSFTDEAKDWEFEATLESDGDTAVVGFDAEGLYEFSCSEHGEDVGCGVVLVGGLFNTPAYSHPGLPCEEEG